MRPRFLNRVDFPWFSQARNAVLQSHDIVVHLTGTLPKWRMPTRWYLMP